LNPLKFFATPGYFFSESGCIAILCNSLLKDDNKGQPDVQTIFQQ